MTMGFPYDIVRLSEEDIAYAKQELGLPRTKTVYVNITSGKTLENVFSLLLDQGNIASLVVYCNNQKVMQGLSAMSYSFRRRTRWTNTFPYANLR